MLRYHFLNIGYYYSVVAWAIFKREKTEQAKSSSPCVKPRQKANMTQFYTPTSIKLCHGSKNLTSINLVGYSERP